METRSTFRLPVRALSPGNRILRAASFFTAAGVMDEAGRRAKLLVVFAAETKAALHDDYHRNTGVVPHCSNAALLRDIPDDIDVYLFGSNCRSVSRAGKKDGLGREDDWKDFDRVVIHMSESSVKACLFECSDDLVHDPGCERVLVHVIGAFEAAGFDVKFDSACPTDFGWGVTRRRAIFVCLRKRVAEVAGFNHDAIRVLTSGPIGKHTGRTKCVEDYLERPRGGPTGLGVINFEEWSASQRSDHGEEWAISWFPAFDQGQAERHSAR